VKKKKKEQTRHRLDSIDGEGQARGGSQDDSEKSSHPFVRVTKAAIYVCQERGGQESQTAIKGKLQARFGC